MFHNEIVNNIGELMYELIKDLYPICRSITGNGSRDTLDIIKKTIPLEVHEIPTGTQVFDWTVPREWNIRDAYIQNLAGERIVDFHKSNLHVVGYSVPVKKKLSLTELKNHLYTLPDYPDWIPYRTSYYKEQWGFCLSHKQLLALEESDYEVCIDASLDQGHLTYGEFYLAGEQPDEILISCHICHPSLCNDNLSGIALAVFLAHHLSQCSRRYSYRFLFTPGTIGSITWLALHQSQAQRIQGGLVLACVGDAGTSTYKKSRQETAEIDRAVLHVLKHTGQEYTVLEFSPYGYDERQFCSPGFNLPVGCLMRTPYGQYPQYHTSADDLDFIQPQALADSFSKCLAVMYLLEHNRTYVNQNPHCEPQLGKRGLYRSLGGQTHEGINELALLWTLNLSDGRHSLLDIAERAGLEFTQIKNAADALLEHDLLRVVEVEASSGS
jgi:aminopeptidase-like protein